MRAVIDIKYIDAPGKNMVAISNSPGSVEYIYGKTIKCSNKNEVIGFSEKAKNSLKPLCQYIELLEEKERG